MLQDVGVRDLVQHGGQDQAVLGAEVHDRHGVHAAVLAHPLHGAVDAHGLPGEPVGVAAHLHHHAGTRSALPHDLAQRQAVRQRGDDEVRRTLRDELRQDVRRVARPVCVVRHHDRRVPRPGLRDGLPDTRLRLR